MSLALSRPPYAGQVIRVLLADDEAMIRAGVRTILTTDPGMKVVAEAADGRDAVELTLRHRPDIALLDIRMPRLDGLAAAKELRRVAPGTSLIMLTTFSEDEFIDRALGLGVHGFVLKSGDPRELIAGVRAVSRGGAYLSPEVAHRIITHLHGSGRLDRAARARTRLEGLTDRWELGFPTRRSQPGCTWSRARSRHTSARCWRGWASGTACSWRSWLTRLGCSTATEGCTAGQKTLGVAGVERGCSCEEGGSCPPGES